ncbi:MAG: helix-turn-helix domain-containing protein [Candidatus Lokiarchaeota archaeon]|nr:helix-turn-helix domain-containing protein [Candidatus Lokiarchaeota archaeon]
MKLNRAIKVRLYPNQAQEVMLNTIFGCCRFIYNKMLEELIKVYEQLKGDSQALYDHRYKTGKYLILVNRYFPSSKLCSCCGYKNENLELNDRKWTCPRCHTHNHRDINASKNIE